MQTSSPRVAHVRPELDRMAEYGPTWRVCVLGMACSLNGSVAICDAHNAPLR